VPRERQRRFGDVGIEGTGKGEVRKVMWLTAGKVLVLSSTVEDEIPEAEPGNVTWEIKNTDWNDPETVENDQK
jgi:hypothetical protein